MGKEINLIKASKKYGDTLILKEIDLHIQAGERLVLLGPSGSGKSTLLRMIAGLEKITTGDIFLDNELANHKECGERDMAMVFQNYALYPHMSVSDNITFALKANKVKSEEIEKRLVDALDMLALTPFKDRLPKDLSGGQRQRTALARAIVKRSDYFLLDEPLSNLDVRLRQEARMELVRIHNKYNQTFVYVTHDQIEAMTLARRIVLLNEGEIQMIDTPLNVYLRPTNLFTATFIGSPGMNILTGNFRGNHYLIGGQSIPLDYEWEAYLKEQADGLVLGIRPENIHLSKIEGDVRGVIEYKELMGQHYALTISVSGEEIIVLSDLGKWHVGDTVYLDFPTEKLHFFSKETTQNLGYPFELKEGEMTDEIFTFI